ncbi:hypothetical protein [Streptomyces sp. NPDC091040]
MSKVLAVTTLICMTALATAAHSGVATASPRSSLQNGCIMILSSPSNPR